MNKLLPNPYGLEPILDSRQTFSDNVMSQEFNKLNDEDKLKILCDLVKQTMIYKKYPAPKIEVEAMIGDDYTASKVLKKYIDELGIFNKVKIMLITNREGIDSKNYNGLHFVVYVKSVTGREYIVDPSPGIGYGYGEVNDISKNNLYHEYIEIDSNIESILLTIREDMYQISNNIYTYDQIDHLKLIKDIFNTDYFNGLLLMYNNCVMNSDHEKLKDAMVRIYSSKITTIQNINKINEYEKIEVLKKWKDQLSTMINNESEYKKQQKLAQYIVGELDNCLSINIGGEKVLLKHITPRLIWERGYNVVIIKPSSYLVGVASSSEKMIIPKAKNIITSYKCNLGEKNYMGLKPMMYFHPHGIKYEQQMIGPSKIILVKELAHVLNNRKHIIRDSFAQKINGHYVEWYNGQKVKWDTQLNTNLVHSTDDAVETSVHLLAGYPEYQSFTRFDYPNPILRKVKK